MKRAPAFQCYASNIIANKQYRLMTLIERGIFTSIYYECWANDTVPADPNELARYLGYSTEDIKTGLTHRVLSFFDKRGSEFFSPELDDYRAALNERNLKKSEGGKKGAEQKRNNALEVSTKAQGTPKGRPERSLVQTKPNQTNQNQSAGTGLSATHDTWVDDYERASRGS
jgi:uncharacterized protein YdaU (DUF1376 family)